MFCRLIAIACCCWMVGCNRQSPYVNRVPDADLPPHLRGVQSFEKEKAMLQEMERVHAATITDARTETLGERAEARRLLEQQSHTLSDEEYRQLLQTSEAAEPAARRAAAIRRQKADEAIHKQRQRVELARQREQ